MSSFEFNKIFAALLCAMITVYLAGFFVEKTSYKKGLEKDAVTIDGAESSDGHGGPEKEETAEPILALLANADIGKGQKITKACAACHSFEKGGPVKQGPNLWNIVMADKAAVAGFDYSDALKEKGGQWDYASLNEFLWKPKKYANGTKMNFIGLKKPEDRAAIIAWLRQQADSPAALPTAGDIAAEMPKEEEPVEENHGDEATPAEDPAHH
ncbi:MAG: cytochrome c family protein [Alphaproteobacteria bacterium]|nr:cytochrome c family protein [Alphaproteobacteria bacterium]